MAVELLIKCALKINFTYLFFFFLFLFTFLNMAMNKCKIAHVVYICGPHLVDGAALE